MISSDNAYSRNLKDHIRDYLNIVFDSRYDFNRIKQGNLRVRAGALESFLRKFQVFTGIEGDTAELKPRENQSGEVIYFLRLPITLETLSNRLDSDSRHIVLLRDNEQFHMLPPKIVKILPEKYFKKMAMACNGIVIREQPEKSLRIDSSSFYHAMAFLYFHGQTSVASDLKTSREPSKELTKESNGLEETVTQIETKK